MTWVSRVALTLAFAVGATACGQGPLTAPPPPTGVSIRGTVSVAMPRPASLDPSNVLDASGEMIVRTMCDPLIDVDRVTGALVPALVQSWIVTDGGTRIVLRLRDGLTFPDGTPATSQDVVFSLSRAASADFAGENANLFAGIVGHDVLRGREEAREPRHRREYQGIRVLSATAFELNLDDGAQFVLPQLTHPTASLLSEDAALRDPRAFAASPVCVGPYRPLAAFDPDAATFELERVASYPGVNEAHVAGGQGFIERFSFHWTPAEGEQDQARDAPRVALPGFDAQDVVVLDAGQRRAADASTVHRVLTAPRPEAQYLGIPDALVGSEGRRALSLALDREAIAAALGEERAGPLSSFLPPSLGTDLHRPSSCDVLSATGDVQAARRALSAAGVDLRGVRFPIVTNPEFDNAALVAEVARQWRAAFPGFSPVVEEVEWDDFRRTFDDPAGFTKGFRTSHRVPFPSPALWLSPFRTASIGSTNAVAFADGIFDELVGLQAAKATDPVDQGAVFRQAEDRLCQALPMLPLVHGQRAWSIGPGLASATGDIADLADSVTGGIRLRDLHRP